MDARPAAWLLAAVALCAAQAAAQGEPARDVVQQRLPDGRILLTDRPQADARTERSWQFAPEDRGAAEARRVQAQREADAVSGRIARQIERDLELQLARARWAQSEAERETARVRAEALAEPASIVVWPRWAAHRPHPPWRPPRPPEARIPERPGPKLPPRPGAMPPPRGPLESERG